VALNFPEPIELRVLADYVGERLGVNILYDEQINNKRVTLRAPERVPVASLMGLLESALKLKGLALVDADQPGWKKIVAVRNVSEIAAAVAADGQALAEAAGAVRIVPIGPLLFCPLAFVCGTTRAPVHGGWGAGVA